MPSVGAVIVVAVAGVVPVDVYKVEILRQVDAVAAVIVVVVGATGGPRASWLNSTAKNAGLGEGAACAPRTLRVCAAPTSKPPVLQKNEGRRGHGRRRTPCPPPGSRGGPSAAPGRPGCCCQRAPAHRCSYCPFPRPVAARSSGPQPRRGLYARHSHFRVSSEFCLMWCNMFLRAWP